MDKIGTRCGAVIFSVGLGLTVAVHDAQGQGSCGLSQDEIVAQARASLAPGSGLLRASSGRLGGAAAGVAGGNQGCALDVVVALSNIRPDAAGDIAEAVAELFPDQEAQLLATARDLGGDAVAPAAGFGGAYEGPYDDDQFDDDDDDGASPS